MVPGDRAARDRHQQRGGWRHGGGRPRHDRSGSGGAALPLPDGGGLRARPLRPAATARCSRPPRWCAARAPASSSSARMCRAAARNWSTPARWRPPAPSKCPPMRCSMTGAMAPSRRRLTRSTAHGTQGADAVLFTSRTLLQNRADEAANLRIGRQISSALVAIVRGLARAARLVHRQRRHYVQRHGDRGARHPPRDGARRADPRRARLAGGGLRPLAGCAARHLPRQCRRGGRPRPRNAGATRGRGPAG